ncbi:MAG: hypothetical protein ABIP29_07175, partial [Candidatus Eisenbacteria bacterium]
MPNRTRTPRASLVGVVALLLAQVVLLAPAAVGEAAPRKRSGVAAGKSAPIPTSAEREFDVAKALLSAQNALPRIQAHMNARRYEDAALLLDQTRGRVSEARSRASDKRLKKSLEDVAKKAERMAD